ncbi:MAG: hypothetical protein ABIO16_02125 [Nocardioides sp.]
MTSTGLLSGRRTTRRDLRFDAVRGVALIAMYLAHCAPSAGPGNVIELTEYATYPLFALLVGVGAELGRRSTASPWWVGPLVCGAALLVMAQVLEQLITQVWIVLAFLGVLTWLAAPLARAGTAWVAGVGVAALLLAPWLNGLDVSGTLDQPGGLRTFHLVRFLVVGGPDVNGPYQLASMVFFAAIGILLTRHLLDGPALRVGLLAAVATGVGAALYKTGALVMLPYHVTLKVLVFDAVLIVAITLLGAVLAGRLPGLAAPLAAAGSMSLTLYSLQILWLWYDVTHLHPGAVDDSWLNVLILTVGSLVIALVWRAVVRIDPWRRGPLEGPVAAVVSALTRKAARA